jgi:hypothetical protein
MDKVLMAKLGKITIEQDLRVTKESTIADFGFQNPPSNYK